MSNDKQPKENFMTWASDKVLESCKCQVAFHNVETEGAPRWKPVLHREECPVHAENPVEEPA